MRRLISSLFSVGKTSTSPDDTGGIQKVQVRLSQYETLDHRMVMGTYGLISSPPVGSDAVLACASGQRTNGFVIATNHRQYRYRNAKPGEVGLSNGVAGSVLLLAADGTLVINIPGAKVLIEGATVFAKDFQTESGVSLAAHLHGGVQAGASDTGAPVTS